MFHQEERGDTPYRPGYNKRISTFVSLRCFLLVVRTGELNDSAKSFDTLDQNIRVVKGLYEYTRA